MWISKFFTSTELEHYSNLCNTKETAFLKLIIVMMLLSMVYTWDVCVRACVCVEMVLWDYDEISPFYYPQKAHNLYFCEEMLSIKCMSITIHRVLHIYYHIPIMGLSFTFIFLQSVLERGVLFYYSVHNKSTSSPPTSVKYTNCTIIGSLLSLFHFHSLPT